MIVAVDTGGTKTLITAFSSDGTPGEMFRFPTPPNTDEDVAKLTEMLQQHYADQVVEAVVIAIPGIVEDGVALWCNNLKWKNFDLAKAFAGVLGDAPIVVENDANLGGLSEARRRDPVPASALYVTISTGIGTGFITNGKIDTGLRRSEGGHIPLYYDGQMRIWESFASGKALYTTYGKYARDITDGKTWQDATKRMSIGFLTIIPLLQPDIIMIGGSVGTYFDRYGHFLIETLQQKLPDHIPCPTIVAADHPEEAVIYGCYYHAVDTLAL